MKSFNEFLDEISKDLLHRYRDANYQAKDKLEVEKGLAWYKGQRTDDPREKFAHRVEFKNKVRALKKRKKGDELAVRALTRKQNESLNESVDEDAVHKVLHHLKGSYRNRYVDKAGNKFHGISVHDMPSALRDHGYRRVSRDHSDSSELARAGFKIRHGAYDQGARPTGKHVAVVHAFDHGSAEHQSILQRWHADAKEKLAKAAPDDVFTRSIHSSAMRSASEQHKKLFGKELS